MSKIKAKQSVVDPYWNQVEETSDTVKQPSLPLVELMVLNFGVDKPVVPEQKCFVREQLSYRLPELHNTVREQVINDTAPEHNYPESLVNSDTSKPYTHWVEKYWVKRRGEKHEYYRYCWMEARKICRCHISGRAGSISASYRNVVICEAILDGQLSPQDIIALIREFRS